MCDQAPYTYSLTVKGLVLVQQTSISPNSLLVLLAPCGREIWSLLDKHLNPTLVTCDA